jgi:hypothetical protein
MSTNQELRFNAYNTRRNLPGEIGRRRGEANFLGAFIRSVLLESPPLHAYGRNFPVPGCGIADLVICELPMCIVEDNSLAGLCLSAFEMKLFDWRKALQQAYRYKYYADMSIVVLPEEKVTRALQSRSLFEALGVGLWTLENSTGVIRKHVPAVKEEHPLNAVKRAHALSRLRARLTHLGKSSEER